MMLMTGTAAERDCLDGVVAGRNFCFLVSWPQDGRRGCERKEAYLPSEAEFSRLRACEHATNPLKTVDRENKLEIGKSKWLRRHRNLKSTECRLGTEFE